MGRELAIGDFVVFHDTCGYKELKVGKILGFTPQKIKVGYGQEFTWTLTTEARRTCRLPAEEVMLYLLRQ